MVLECLRDCRPKHIHTLITVCHRALKVMENIDHSDFGNAGHTFVNEISEKSHFIVVSLDHLSIQENDCAFFCFAM